MKVPSIARLLGAEPTLADVAPFLNTGDKVVNPKLSDVASCCRPVPLETPHTLKRRLLTVSPAAASRILSTLHPNPAPDRCSCSLKLKA